VAPKAAQVAAFEENRRAHAWPIMDRKPLDIKNYAIHARLFAYKKGSLQLNLER